MQDERIKHLLGRLQKLENERSAVEIDWEEVEMYCFPAATQFENPRTEFASNQDRYTLYDGTGVVSTNLLARSMHSSITPPNYPWIDFKLTKNGEDVITANTPIGDEKRRAVSMRTNIVRQEYDYSNFDKECSNFYKNIICYGIGCLYQEMIFDKRRNLRTLMFESISPWEMFPIQNDQGIVDSCYRKFKMTAQQIDERWPDAKDKDPNSKLKKYIDSDKDKLLEVIHYVEKSKDSNYQYSSNYILKEDDMWLQNNGKGYRTFPYHFLFWERIRNKVYANSPAMDAIMDIKALNEMVQIQMEAYEKHINGVWVYARGNIINSELNIGSCAMNEVDDVNEIRNVAEHVRLDVAEHLVQSLRDRIRQTMYIDQIQLPPMEGTPHTATEIQVRVEFQLRILGPMFGAHKFDFLNSLTERSYNLLAEYDKFPDLPASLEDFDIEPVYIGPLAKAQKLNQVTATERLIFDYINLLAQFPQIAQADPEILYLFDWKRVYQEKADATGVPQYVFMAPRDRKGKVEEYQQAQQAQMALQMAQEGSQAEKNLATAEKMRNGG